MEACFRLVNGRTIVGFLKVLPTDILFSVDGCSWESVSRGIPKATILNPGFQIEEAEDSLCYEGDVMEASPGDKMLAPALTVLEIPKGGLTSPKWELRSLVNVSWIKIGELVDVDTMKSFDNLGNIYSEPLIAKKIVQRYLTSKERGTLFTFNKPELEPESETLTETFSRPNEEELPNDTNTGEKDLSGEENEESTDDETDGAENPKME